MNCGAIIRIGRLRSPSQKTLPGAAKLPLFALVQQAGLLMSVEFHAYHRPDCRIKFVSPHVVNGAVHIDSRLNNHRRSVRIPAQVLQGHEHACRRLQRARLSPEAEAPKKQH